MTKEKMLKTENTITYKYALNGQMKKPVPQKWLCFVIFHFSNLLSPLLPPSPNILIMLIQLAGDNSYDKDTYKACSNITLRQLCYWSNL